MPVRPASRELAFFTRVQVAEATLRQVMEQAGAAQVRIQEEQTATRLAKASGKPSGAKGGVDEPGWLLPPNGGRRVERGQDGSAGGGQWSNHK
jgi:hypothetical protein